MRGNTWECQVGQVKWGEDNYSFCSGELSPRQCPSGSTNPVTLRPMASFTLPFLVLPLKLKVAGLARGA